MDPYRECHHNSPKKLVRVADKVDVKLCDACIKEFDKQGLKIQKQG